MACWRSSSSAGNTAIVSQQYSFLPSWVAFIVHRDRAAEAGRALYEAVHERWVQLPEDSRPKLVVFGESLGSYGAEDPFVGDDAAASLTNMADGASAMLYTGPTAGNTIWKQFTDDREEGSPVWRPVFDGGTTVQFANRPTDLEPPDPPGRSLASSTSTIPRIPSGTGAGRRSGASRRG